VYISNVIATISWPNISLCGRPDITDRARPSVHAVRLSVCLSLKRQTQKKRLREIKSLCAFPIAEITSAPVFGLNSQKPPKLLTLSPFPIYSLCRGNVRMDYQYIVVIRHVHAQQEGDLYM